MELDKQKGKGPASHYDVWTREIPHNDRLSDALPDTIVGVRHEIVRDPALGLPQSGTDIENQHRQNGPEIMLWSG